MYSVAFKQHVSQHHHRNRHPHLNSGGDPTCRTTTTLQRLTPVVAQPAASQTRKQADLMQTKTKSNFIYSSSPTIPRPASVFTFSSKSPISHFQTRRMTPSITNPIPIPTRNPLRSTANRTITGTSYACRCDQCSAVLDTCHCRYAGLCRAVELLSQSLGRWGRPAGLPRC